MDAPLELTVESDTARPVLVAVGEVDASTAKLLMKALLELQSRVDGHGVAVDLAGVQFLDSTGLHTLVEGRDALGGRLVLRRPSHIVRRVLELTGVDFQIET
jgi:anti-anti-sigma factor